MAKAELKKKWWLTSKPKEINGAELEKTLGAVEASAADKRIAALTALSPAIAKACKELDKNKHKDLLKELATLETLAEVEIKKLQAAAKLEAKKEKEAEQDDTGGDTPQDKLFDAAFQRSTIKLALRQSLVFAFAIGSKPEQCALALAPRGNPMAFARLAKARSGVAKVCCGELKAADGDAKTLVLTLTGTPVSGIVKALRNVLRARGITQFLQFSVVVEGKVTEAESSDENAPGETAASPATPSPADLRAAEAAAAEKVEKAEKAKQLKILEERRNEFKNARAGWVAVKARAEADLEKVKDGARMAYLADPKQYPKIEKGCKAIDAILDNLDDELRDTLDQYAATPLTNKKKLEQLAASATEVLDGYREYVAKDAVMKAIDEKEFANVTVHAPVLKALNDLRKALS